MKRFCAVVVAWVLVVSGSLGAAVPEPELVSESVNDRGAHQKVVQRVTREKRNSAFLQTNYIVELTTGGSYFEDGKWKDASAEFEITFDGAVANKLGHKLHVNGNIRSSPGALTVTTPDNQVIRASVRGIAYTDPIRGSVVMFASVKDAGGVLTARDTIIFPDAFDGTRADVRAVVTKAGLESDVILREKLPSPTQWNLDPESTLVEVWTAFDAPVPSKDVQSRGGLRDETLDFGTMRMGRGSAFLIEAGDGRRRQIPVAKTWMTTPDGKTYLIESVRYSAIRQELARLRDRQAGVAPAVPALQAPDRVAALKQLAPVRQAATRPVRLAADRTLLDRSPGLVIDFTLSAGNQTNFTFQANTTYFINGIVNLFGETTFENAIIKFATTNGTVVLETWSNVTYKTDFYRPVIFTSQMDRSVGADLYAAGASTNYSHALSSSQQGIEHHHLRIAYANVALHITSAKIRHAQFIQCGQAISSDNGTMETDNALFYKCGIPFTGFIFQGAARHVTLDECGTLAYDDWDVPEYPSYLALTNSLLVNVTNTGNVQITTNSSATATNGVFQTVGAGMHYLAESSPYRDSGTSATNLPPALLSDLRKLTTYPPQILNGEIAQSATWSVTAPRDTDANDLGYHYSPIDVLYNAVWATNAIVTVAPGVALAVYSTTNSPGFLTLAANGHFICEGRADNLNHITTWQLVQETVPANLANGAYLLTTPFTWLSPPPGLMRVRFTELTAPDPATAILQGYDPVEDTPPIALVDCQLYGGSVVGYLSHPVAFTNNLLFRVPAQLYHYSGDFRNNTFYGGSVGTWLESGGFYDNIFENVAIESGSEAPNDFNGYATNAANQVLFSTLASNVVFSGSVLWQTGPLGACYLPTNSVFLDRGSRNADAAMLYHFTSTTNQVKETNSIVNLGFHYIATDANGNPLDFENDGVPDYWEDGDGDGSYDSGTGETDWQAYNSANGLSNSPSLKVYTPLK